MKKFFISIILLLAIFMNISIYASADTDTDALSDTDEPSKDMQAVADFELDAKSAVLMEASTGKILYEMNADEELPPASVTKIMTLLLVMEAIDSGKIALTDTVTVSAYAASMGGSQVFLEEGEQMTLEDLLKCTVIASANDAAVALAEYLMGSEEAFVARMNERAGELGLNDASFENVTGLDDDTVNHVMSARDVAVISKELVSHKKILEYSSVWMDTIRNGAFTLTNTNRLVRYYDGATGFKTGSTDKAKFCVTATAKKGNLSLIAVIMGAPSRDVRNACAKTLFDWGFANYTVYTDDACDAGDIPVICGTADALKTRTEGFSVVLPKEQAGRVTRNISLTSTVEAPVALGDVVGTVTYLVDGEVIGTANVRALNGVEKLNYWGLLVRMIKIFILS